MKVDLVIVGPTLRTLDSIELIRRLREMTPRPPVLVYSQLEVVAELAFKAGADGYVMKQEAPERLIDAIREVLAGRKYVSQRLPSK
jgi:DNA-binding NarL/FixJ family response regulator